MWEMCWKDFHSKVSTVGLSIALHWIKGGGDYKQFVSNQVQKIQEKEYIQWRHVGTEENPADLGSSGRGISNCLDLWWHGPSWPRQMAYDTVTTSTKETQAEAKIVKELLGVTTITDDQLDLMMRKWDLWKAIQICSWVARFVWNSRTKHQQRITKPITTEQMTKQLQFWAQISKERSLNTYKFEEDKLQLNLQKNAAGIVKCRSPIQGYYLIYLLDDAVFAEKLVMHTYLQTLHGGVGLTMARVKECHWVPWLRGLMKRVVQSCYGCKRYEIMALANPPTGSLPKKWTEGSVPFKYFGVDFAGPVKYLNKSKREMKAYVVLYACCLTRAMYLEILPNLSVEEFIHSIKQLIARQGRPGKIFWDNWKTFIAAAVVEEDREWWETQWPAC